MAIPYERLGIPAPLRRSVAPDAPKSAKVAVAKGLLPTTADVQISLLYVLAVDPDESVSGMARSTLTGLPEDQILSGLSQRTFPKILEFITKFRTDSPVLDERIIHLRQATTRAAVSIARRAGADLSEVICRHQERLLLSPEVYVALHANPQCSDDDLGRAKAFLRMHQSLPEVAEYRPFREAPAETEQEPEPAPAAEVEAPAQPEPLSPAPVQPAAPQPAAAPVAMQPSQQPTERLSMFDLDAVGDGGEAVEAFQFDFQDEMASFSWDLTGDDDEEGEEEEEEEYKSIEKRIADMSVGEKIKLAYLGNKQARGVLVRDSNKIVSSAVVKSGRLTPGEVATYAGNRNLSDEVVREIAKNNDFTRKYPVKVALVNNPKTPVSVAIKFIQHLHRRDLQALSNNRNVSSVIFNTAKKAFKDKYRK
jgi:hypothetical protein